MSASVGDEAVARRADQVALFDLVSLYFYLLDTDQHERAADLFADDVIDDHGSAFGGELRGREAMRDVFRGARSVFEATQHFIGSHHLDVVGDEASGYFYVQAWHWLASSATLGPGRPADLLLLAAQVLDFRRVDGTWLITRQRVDMFGPGSGVALGELPGAFGDGFGADILPRLYPPGGWRPH